MSGMNYNRPIFKGAHAPGVAPPPTDAQINYIRFLERQKSMPVVTPTTLHAAKRRIEYLLGIHDPKRHEPTSKKRHKPNREKKPK